ncbi:MAG TPA: hypothetical protein VF624_04805 [Tepidisphaeraceae bacterium]|jgi:hypothetical protein
MGVREQLKEKPAIGFAVTAAFVLIAVLVLARTYWPEEQADLSRAFYTIDDGQTWFTDSATKVAPFDYNGKTAVVAHVYNYANGSKEFCAYLAKFTPEAKTKLEAAITDAARAGKPPESVSLYGDRSFMSNGVLVKPAGPGGEWVPYGDPKAKPLFAVRAPDGSVVDQVFP